MNSYSQAGQDLYVYSKLPKTNGTFVDIGCGHAVNISNTLALEELGWRGVLLDIGIPDQIECRKSRFIQADAKSVDWWDVLAGFPTIMDYLSLDVDRDSLDALRNIANSVHRFRVITVEHDSYRFGDALRAPMRELLTGLGYKLDRPDVQDQGLPFEDWWVWP